PDALGAVFLFVLVTPPPAIHSLSLHDALPIFGVPRRDLHGEEPRKNRVARERRRRRHDAVVVGLFHVEQRRDELAQDLPLVQARSEDHTSELQSRSELVCRLLLEKRNTTSLQP